jgi:hypothetical protein
MRVTVYGDYALTMQRGTYLLMVAFADEQRLPRVKGARLLLDTEQDIYAENGRSPRIEENEIYFPVTAAALFVDESHAN